MTDDRIVLSELAPIVLRLRAENERLRQELDDQFERANE